jgi:hypothetical protein
MLAKKPIAIIVLACGYSVFAQQAPNPNTQGSATSKAAENALFTSMTLETFQKILQAMGFEVTREADKDGKPSDYLYFQTEGYRSVATMNDGDVALVNVTTGKVVPSTYNDWNSSLASCCFAFSSPDSDTHELLSYLATQVSFEGGMTKDGIESRVKHFRDAVAAWKRFLADHQVKESTVKPQ